MTDKQRKDAENIYKTLSLQRFADFYGIGDDEDVSPFGSHLSGDKDALSKEKILKMIVDLFEL